jgi:thiol-disulfide isomerase/thioredoxin
MKNNIFFFFIFLLSIAGLYIYFSAEAAIGIDKGYTLANINFPAHPKEAASLYDYSSDYILLEVWATWCPNCRRENKAMIQTIDRHKNSLKVIAISLDSDSTLWETVKRQEMSSAIDHYRDSSGWDSKYATLLKIESLPFNIFMDRDFLIIDKNVSAEQLEKLMQKSH